MYQGIQITLPYTLAVFLVRHFEAGQSEERIGRLTGILAASFSAAQFFTSYLWGVFMDRFGRKVRRLAAYTTWPSRLQSHRVYAQLCQSIFPAYSCTPVCYTRLQVHPLRS